MSEERMDALFAPIYDENWGTVIAATHQQFFDRFLKLSTPHGMVLDAACGTGKYWPLLLEAGRSIFGIDQSQGMLRVAQHKHPAVPVEKIGLQEMSYREAFDDAICMDAMEFIFPEDWPLVLANLTRALKPAGMLYFTVEIAQEADLQNAYDAGRQLGLPVVYGEWAHEGGYHYYPDMEQVREWVSVAQFHFLEETVGDEYNHFLVQKQL